MRTLKFRAWHGKRHKLYEVAMLYTLVKAVLVRNGDALCSYLFSEVEVMQFTGAKDIHGKDIYEGDIVQWDGPPQEGFLKSLYRRAVTWENDQAMFLPNQMHGEVEVIGNIYENPELLPAKE